MKVEEIVDLVQKWRAINPKVVNFWKSLNNAAIHTISTGEPTKLSKLRLKLANGNLYIRCPNGMSLSYPQASLKQGEHGLQITYTRIRRNGICTETTYGGKLVENVTQAVAFHLLRETLLRLENWNVVMHVHDEVIIEKKYFYQTLETAIKFITRPIPWCTDLTLKADGFVSQYYKKG